MQSCQALQAPLVQPQAAPVDVQRVAKRLAVFEDIQAPARGGLARLGWVLVQQYHTTGAWDNRSKSATITLLAKQAVSQPPPHFLRAVDAMSPMTSNAHHCSSTLQLQTVARFSMLLT